ncbi:Arginine exporter protein ArgO [Corynebacterium occultum]|uniref:Arginine exporter protein ArgO n=1 Tax=Corynebacterium occultum TaxID=2675219 RepID=A0A6B8WAW4_9CORY|nr:LysE/ArgO family amino acid transporter [Corynebacterium occultum]QGU07150.1 Arginine exporter protein ArgO [Corynebacterium occultum]
MKLMSIVLSGFLLGLSLIVAIGPQNILLLKQGVRREGITAVILVCLISDVILFTAGTLGVGVLTESAPLVLEVIKWAGVAYLGWFALLALRDALRPGEVKIVEESAPRASNEVVPSGSGSAVLTRTRVLPSPTRIKEQALSRPWFKPMMLAIALTWLNPGAYLDSLVMIGGIANQHGDTGRWLFSGGAFLASLLWFPVVGYGARLLSRPLSSPRVWRVLNVIIAVVLGVIATNLALM